MATVARVTSVDAQYFRNETTGRTPVFRGRAGTPARSGTALPAESPPTFLIRVAAEAEVPPVASRSSIRTILLARLDGVDVQFHFGLAVLERVFRAFGFVRQAALFAERHKTDLRVRRRRRSQREIRARRSRQFCRSPCPRHCSRKTSIEARKSSPLLRIGVMSLKTIPGLGKSGTSRTAARSLSIESATMAGG